MTVNEVFKMIQEIEKLIKEEDYEAAHSKENELYKEVLSAIAEGRCASPKVLASKALRADELEFPRWFK